MTVVDLKDINPIPGLEAVGHGIYLQPRQPYILRNLLFKQEKFRRCNWTRDASGAYSVPDGYEVNDTPPMPTNQLLNQTLIEESWERFDKEFALDASVSFGQGPFSINAGVAEMSQLREEEESYYAVRSSFIPMWGVYLPDCTRVTPEINKFDIPVPFKHIHRKIYNEFFDRFGSHFVRRVWVGGKALLFFTVAKSSNLTKEEIQAGLQATYGGVGGSVGVRNAKSKEKLQSNSKCSVSGRGGDEFLLASLSSLDEEKYNKWLDTIKNNPQTIEMEVAGLWTLIQDPKKAEALNEAYKAENTFTPLTAAFTSVDRKIFFLRGNKYFTYDVERSESFKPKPMAEQWPDLEKVGFEWIDAAFRAGDLVFSNGETMKEKLFLFCRDQYVRIDGKTNKIDPGYPKLIAEGWPGVTFERVDATVEIEPNHVYFFSGSNYIRFDTKKGRADAGYPQPIAKRWVGVTFDRIDATIFSNNGKLYFFRGDQYIRYDMVVYRADAGYPKYITGNYVEDWKTFDIGL